MPRVAGAALVGIAAVLLASTPARATNADEKDACIKAAESGQDLRDGRQYRLARDAFARCARDTCPAVIRKDCADWLGNTDEKLATIVVAAQDAAGHDLAHVRVTLDGQALPQPDGKPVAVDPGTHVMRWEADGFSPVEQQVVVGAGEKNHLVGAKLVVVPAPSPAPEPPATAPAPAPEPAAPPRVDPEAASAPTEESAGPWSGVPAGTWVFAGVAIVGFASEAYFGVTAMNERSQDFGPGGCAPHCGTGEQNAIRTKAALADVSMGVGIASGVLAGYLLFSSRSPSGGADATVGVAPAPGAGGAVATVRGHF